MQSGHTKLAALNATLAEATKACPGPKDRTRLGGKDYPHNPYCICQGTGEVAMFEGFRQVCEQCGPGGSIHVTVPPTPCRYCKGLSRQVRAGGMAGALAGLSRGQALAVYAHVVGTEINIQDLEALDDPMPDADTILVKALELVCEIKGLEVP